MTADPSPTNRFEDAEEARMVADPKFSTALVIHGPDNEPLLSISNDGEVTGTIENASEAARVFVQELRRIGTWPGGTTLRDRTVMVDLAYPRLDDHPNEVRVELMDVRAADDLVIRFDFPRNGWTIHMDQLDGSTIALAGVIEPLQEVAFVPAWNVKGEESTTAPDAWDEGRKAENDYITSAWNADAGTESELPEPANPYRVAAPKEG